MCKEDYTAATATPEQLRDWVGDLDGQVAELTARNRMLVKALNYMSDQDCGVSFKNMEELDEYIAEWVSKSDADFEDNKTLLAQLREVLDLKKGQLIDTNKGALDIFKVEAGRVYYGFLATGETADEPMDEFMKKFNKEAE